MNNPYDKCPVFETEKFIIRLVEKSDAEDLLGCYSDVNAQKYFNAYNCTSDFKWKTLEEINEYMDFWIQAYNDRAFVRFSIVQKLIKKAIGTIEFFGGPYGVLRIDIKSEYEKEEYLKDIIEISVNNFYKLFNTNRIITKAIPEAVDRINVLMDYGFIEYTQDMNPPRNNYYFRDL
jgi:RimJ/RimL family protein N-acetyltransferase